MNRFDITAPSLICWLTAAPQHCAVNHPQTYLDVLLIRPERSSLILAVSALIKGSSQVVDAQKLAASPNTDKSRFLTMCYALATILDVSSILMQPHFDLVPRAQKHRACHSFFHDRKARRALTS
jgi:hypothetical protein